MDYIVMDLEFNQFFSSKNSDSTIKTDCPFEIIQIGAVKLSNSLKILSTFNRLVKPQVYTKLHPYVKEITGLATETLLLAQPFTKVYSEFVEFVEDSSNILCIWGFADIKELYRNVQFYKLDTKLVPNKYINIQSYANIYFNVPKGNNVGLKNALELLKFPTENKFHDAFFDAQYTAAIFKELFNESIIPQIYNHELKSKPKERIKKDVDVRALFSQFEKMYNREMTEEEKKIIKLAYFMGKTNQFQRKPKGI